MSKLEEGKDYQVVYESHVMRFYVKTLVPIGKSIHDMPTASPKAVAEYGLAGGHSEVYYQGRDVHEVVELPKSVRKYFDDAAGILPKE